MKSLITLILFLLLSSCSSDKKKEVPKPLHLYSNHKESLLEQINEQLDRAGSELGEVFVLNKEKPLRVMSEENYIPPSFETLIDQQCKKDMDTFSINVYKILSLQPLPPPRGPDKFQKSPPPTGGPGKAFIPPKGKGKMMHVYHEYQYYCPCEDIYVMKDIRITEKDLGYKRTNDFKRSKNLKDLQRIELKKFIPKQLSKKL